MPKVTDGEFLASQIAERFANRTSGVVPIAAPRWLVAKQRRVEMDNDPRCYHLTDDAILNEDTIG